MALVVGAHLVIRSATANTTTPCRSKFAVSLLLFGIGAAFRWDAVAYLAAIAADLFFRAGDRAEHLPNIIARLRLSFMWSTLAGLTWLMMVLLNGWSPEFIIHTMLSQGPVESLDWKLGLARAQTFFTPAFLVFYSIGFYVLIRKRSSLALVFIISILPVLRLLVYGVPKWFITAIPSFIGCAVFGLCFISSSSSRTGLKYALIALLVFPWLVGIQWSYEGTAWGPGFEAAPILQCSEKQLSPYTIFWRWNGDSDPRGTAPVVWARLGATWSMEAVRERVRIRTGSGGNECN